MTAMDERLAAMDAALARIQQMGEVRNLEPDAVSYGMLPFDLSGYWDETVGRFRILMEGLSRAAAAESSVDGGAQARSVIGWTGALSTVWAEQATPEQRQAHYALLEANLRYRARLILILTASVRVAALLCAAAASPLMAPAALRSLVSLVAELQGLAERG
jgi:hypothetical protein